MSTPPADGEPKDVEPRPGSSDIRVQALYDQLAALEREMVPVRPVGMWQRGGFALVLAAMALWLAATESVAVGAVLGLVLLSAVVALLRNHRKLKKLEAERERVVEQLGVTNVRADSTDRMDAAR